MAKYWLSCLSWENFQIDRENEFVLAGYREQELKQVLRVEPGDRLVYYIKRLRVFAALCEARSRSYIDWSPIWRDDTYPCRFERRPLLELPRALMVAAGPLLPRLSFARGRNPCRLPQRGDLREIPERDFEIIEQEMRRRGEGH